MSCCSTESVRCSRQAEGVGLAAAMPPMNVGSSSDFELFEAWRGGNRRAGDELFERHFAEVHQFFSNRVGRDAEDLTQRTFLACEESKERIQGGSTFRTFIFAVARNLLSKHYRTKRRRDDRMETYDGALSDPSPSSSVVMAVVEDRERLLSAMRRLPGTLRRMLEMYYWERRTTADVARTLGVPHGTARTRIRRAKTLLREELERSATPRAPAWPAGARCYQH